jgi:hypothetical protein
MNAMNRAQSKPQLGILSASVAVIAVVWLTGCTTTGYKKADAAALNSRVAAGSVQAENQELQATMAALNNLVNQPEADAKPQFLKFEQALNRLVSAARRARSEVNGVWEKWDAYFEVWEKEIPLIQDSATRSLSETRKMEVSNEFQATKRRYTAASKDVQPLISYLQDIRKALSIDLTSAGLVAIKPSVFTANERAQKVQTALAQSATELDTFSARTASFGVQQSK